MLTRCAVAFWWLQIHDTSAKRKLETWAENSRGPLILWRIDQGHGQQILFPETPCDTVIFVSPISVTFRRLSNQMVRNHQPAPSHSAKHFVSEHQWFTNFQHQCTSLETRRPSRKYATLGIFSRMVRCWILSYQSSQMHQLSLHKKACYASPMRQVGHGLKKASQPQQVLQETERDWNWMFAHFPTDRKQIRTVSLFLEQMEWPTSRTKIPPTSLRPKRVLELQLDTPKWSREKNCLEEVEPIGESESPIRWLNYL